MLSWVLCWSDWPCSVITSKNYFLTLLVISRNFFSCFDQLSQVVFWLYWPYSELLGTTLSTNFPWIESYPALLARGSCRYWPCSQISNSSRFATTITTQSKVAKTISYKKINTNATFCFFHLWALILALRIFFFPLCGWELSLLFMLG